MLNYELLKSGNPGKVAVNIDEVYAQTNYAGSGAARSVQTGVDMTGRCLLWVKRRNTGTASHCLADYFAGAPGATLASNTTAARSSIDSSVISALNSDGYSPGSSALTNASGSNYIAHSFKAKPRFFDSVQFTSTGSGAQNIAHNLQAEIGMILTKRTDAAGSWMVYHRGDGPGSGNQNGGLSLNLTTAAQFAAFDMGTTMNDKTFSTGNMTSADNVSPNSAPGTYVSYLFAHDPGPDGVVFCGQYTGNGAANGPEINIGWEPQFILVKRINGTGSWYMLNDEVGMGANTANYVKAETNDMETSSAILVPTSTGFRILSTLVALNASAGTYLFMAIRRSRKPPSSGAEVFNALLRTGTGSAANVSTGIKTDLLFTRSRSTSSLGFYTFDRLRGPGVYMGTASTAAQSSNSSTVSAMDLPGGGVTVGTTTPNANGTSTMFYALKRATGFFDMVKYRGNGVARSLKHNLEAIPEFAIVVASSAAGAWRVLPPLGKNYMAELNTNAGSSPYGADGYDVTKSTIELPGASTYNNASGTEYMAYLFASLPGISKVLIYNGDNSSSRFIDCGFAGGARFVMIKDILGGDWYVWDSVRGITAGASPSFAFNSTAAEASGTLISPVAGGFGVNTGLNTNGETYLVFAIA